MTKAERRAQAISFAYGNAAIANPSITKEMVAKAYDELHPCEFCGGRGSFRTRFKRVTVVCPDCDGGGQ